MNINIDANQVEETLDLSLREREKKNPLLLITELSQNPPETYESWTHE